MACQPVCAVCTGICNAPVPAAPARASGHGRRAWKPNDEPWVRAKCGCEVMPWPIMEFLGEHVEKVLCDLHGWQEIAPVRKAAKPKGKTEVAGQGELIPF